MLALGLVLLGLAALFIVLGLFTVEDPGATASLAGLDLGATTIFILGLVSGVFALVGLRLATWGGKRQLRQAKERRRLQGLASQVEERDRGSGSPPPGPDQPPPPG